VIRSAVIAALLVASLADAQTPSAPVWDGNSLPITVEVSQDVPVKISERRVDGSYGQERGTLYSSVAFLIAKGERFQMVQMLSEGSCRIELNGAQHVLSSCPWVPGFTDNQADIFRIVAFRNR
jgi:hypothetical protein